MSLYKLYEVDPTNQQHDTGKVIELASADYDSVISAVLRKVYGFKDYLNYYKIRTYTTADADISIYYNYGNDVGEKDTWRLKKL